MTTHNTELDFGGERIRELCASCFASRFAPLHLVDVEDEEPQDEEQEDDLDEPCAVSAHEQAAESASTAPCEAALNQNPCDADALLSKWGLSYVDPLVPPPPRTWLVDNILLPGGVTVHVAPFESRKTWSYLDRAVSVALGQDWLGFRVQKPGRVLIINEDMRDEDIKAWLWKVQRGHRAAYPLPVFVKSHRGYNFLDSRHADELGRMARDIQAEYVVIDNLSKVSNNASENDNDKMSLVMGNLSRQAKQHGFALDVIHHTGKDGDSWRGAAAIPDNADQMIQQRYSAKVETITYWTAKGRLSGDLRYVAECIGQRDDDYFRLEIPGTRHVLHSLTEPQCIILLYLREGAVASRKRIEGLGNANTMMAAIRALGDKGKGLITRTNPNAKAPAEALFALTEQGQKMAELLGDGVVRTAATPLE